MSEPEVTDVETQGTPIAIEIELTPEEEEYLRSVFGPKPSDRFSLPYTDIYDDGIKGGSE